MNFEKDASGGQGTLTLAGELTIQCAGDLKDTILRLQESVESLLLNLEGVSGADISCLQVLCSAHRLSVKANKQLGFTGGIPAAFKQAVADAGYAKEVCCTDGCGTCLWAIIRGEA